MRLLWLIILSVVGAAGARVQEQKASRPLAATVPEPRVAKVQHFAVLPATLSFSANDPGHGEVAASAPAQATFPITGGDPDKEWWLSVWAPTPVFVTCGKVPVAAVTVSCASATVAPMGSTALCAAPFRLSTTPQRVAGGRQGSPGQFWYTVVLNLTFRDSWSYMAQRTPPCRVTLNYAAHAP